MNDFPTQYAQKDLLQLQRLLQLFSPVVLERAYDRLLVGDVALQHSDLASDAVVLVLEDSQLLFIGSELERRIVVGAKSVDVKVPFVRADATAASFALCRGRVPP